MAPPPLTHSHSVCYSKGMNSPLITLTAKERATVLGTADKMGYVAVLRFAPLGRSRRAIRPVRTAVAASIERAEKNAAAEQLRYRNFSRVEIMAVDHMGATA